MRLISRKLSSEVRERVLQRLAELGDEPRPPGCRKLAAEEDLYRVRKVLIGPSILLTTMPGGLLSSGWLIAERFTKSERMERSLRRA